MITGVWPLVSMRTFEMVTGPKTDKWLVKTVGVVVAVIGAALLTAAYQQRFGAEVVVLAVGSALGLALIDINYVARRVIPPIYLCDALLELVLAAGWVVGVWSARNGLA